VLKAGDRTPRFELASDGGERVRSEDLSGRVVLYFYPKDDTPGCTREAQGFTAAGPRFAALGARVLGVSRDGTASHCRFKAKYGLDFPLLSDPELTVHKAFGAWGEKTMYGKKVEGVIRSTFILEDGRVVRAFGNVKVEGHVDAVIAALGGDAATAAPKKAPSKKAPSKKAPPKKAPPKKAPPKKPAPKKTAAKKATPKKAARRSPGR
jgi:peroxiredoxin Q/BCP